MVISSVRTRCSRVAPQTTSRSLIGTDARVGQASPECRGEAHSLDGVDPPGLLDITHSASSSLIRSDGSRARMLLLTLA
jgi:hypothetical protein